MKAISIKQPWAELIARGEKSIETRTWETSYRGDLLICASKIPDNNYNFSENLLYGYALCVVELYKIEPMNKSHEKNAGCEVYPGAYAWHMRNIRIIEPFKVKGKLRLYNVDYKL
jgi:hypothetical protein